MRQITYGGGAFVTSDEIADALLEYAAALSNADRAATVHVPAIDTFGKTSDIQVLVGPASQLMSESMEGEETALNGTEFIGGIAIRMETLRRTFIPSEGDS